MTNDREGNQSWCEDLASPQGPACQKYTKVIPPSFKTRDVTVPSGTGPRPGPDRDRTKMHGTAVWSGHGPSVVRSWSGASQDFQDRTNVEEGGGWVMAISLILSIKVLSNIQ